MHVGVALFCCSADPCVECGSETALLTVSQDPRWPATASPLQLAVTALALRECEGFWFQLETILFSRCRNSDSSMGEQKLDTVHSVDCYTANEYRRLVKWGQNKELRKEILTAVTMQNIDLAECDVV
jgi:hypothetical protein